jgi:hypothetical protein
MLLTKWDYHEVSRAIDKTFIRKIVRKARRVKPEKAVESMFPKAKMMRWYVEETRAYICRK